MAATSQRRDEQVAASSKSLRDVRNHRWNQTQSLGAMAQLLAPVEPASTRPAPSQLAAESLSPGMPVGGAGVVMPVRRRSRPRIAPSMGDHPVMGLRLADVVLGNVQRVAHIARGRVLFGPVETAAPRRVSVITANRSPDHRTFHAMAASSASKQTLPAAALSTEAV
jgi:hypothetical protein